MARVEVVEDREFGSRFALNYNQHTTEELFRYAGERRLFETELRYCVEREYWDFYDNSMREAGGNGRRRLDCDFVIEEQSNLIDLRLSSGFSTFKTVGALRSRLRRVKDSRIWLLEIGTPIPEEFQVINDRGAHVKILPSEHAPVTVGKFQEMLCCLNWVKLSIEQENV